jgi:isopentenyl-diphosphate Delta-isomerase
MEIDRNMIALVNENDEITGYENKLVVHQLGLLHRAFSVFIFNSENKILLQRRAFQKYHSGGLWTNTCCSHLALDENFENSVHHRLQEEMGLSCNLEQAFSFRYCAALNNGLIENELDHVFIGYCDNIPSPDKTEVSEWKWVDLLKINDDLIINKENYTYWFNIAFQKTLQYCEIAAY